MTTREIQELFWMPYTTSYTVGNNPVVYQRADQWYLAIECDTGTYGNNIQVFSIMTYNHLPARGRFVQTVEHESTIWHVYQEHM